MAKYVEITVITQTRNRPGIERWIERESPGGIEFSIEYVQFPNPIYRLKSRFDALTFPYYAAWQWLVLRRARELHREAPFDLAHHVTFVSFRVPSLLKHLDIPVVFGPVGGAERASWRLLAHRFSPAAWLKEAVRNLATSSAVALLKVVSPIDRDTGICLAATPNMHRVFQASGYPSDILPAIGIDETLEPGQQSDEGVARKFLYVGRFHPLKGVHLALEAFAAADISGSKLTLIGSGTEERRLRRLAEDLGIASKLEWLGQLPKSVLSDYYRSHDVLLAPSLYESGGLAVLEALQCGCPAIALAVGGHDLSIAEGCGTKIPGDGSAEETVEQIAKAMIAYSIEPGLAYRHGNSGRRDVLNRYGWESKGLRMLEIYQRVLRRANEP